MTGSGNTRPLEIWLIRHGETEWSKSGQHTGRTDIPLTAEGEKAAIALKPRLEGIQFDAVFTSPMQRARETCRLAGLDSSAVIEPNLKEWDYGIYEGKTTKEIQKDTPGWSIWTSSIPEGESIEQAADRAREVIAAASQFEGRVALFAHGHILRILAACWLNDDPTLAKHLVLGTSSLCILGFERTTRALLRWNG
ncbi:histidine phosphatase family protein [Silvibacterium acidisoli]|uniref:histidine phosphatase family protein n=1 Tax=Acidobacteriaceae bacterium ZG23-2 TaxID=2883246 RepID=UPI00406C2264